MLGKIAFVVILVSAATAFVHTGRSFQEESDVVHQQKPDQIAACCPQVSLKPPGSIMDSMSVYRAYFALIIDYGNCTEAIAADSTFVCCGTWGDGKEPMCSTFDKMENCEMAYEYPKNNATYTIMATYCNALSEKDACCTSLSKIVNIGP